MMKVIQVSSDTNIGGAGKCILTYLKFYDRKNFDVSCVVPEGSLLVPLMEEKGVKVFQINSMKDKSFDIKAIRELVSIFKKEKPDIVHAHASMSAKIAAKLSGCRVVYTRHSVFEPSPRISKGVGKLLSGLANNLTADKIIAVAEAAKDNLTATGVDEKKITVLLNGVEPLDAVSPEEKTKLKEKYGVKEDEKVISILARLNVVKGHRYLVDAAKLVKEKGIKAKFLIAGTGDMEAEIKGQIERENLSDTVLMLGFVKDVSEILNITDIQANCSFGTEATSLALLEGMSLKVPAVVTNYGGNPGVIKDGENGFLVPTHDAEKMAEKLCLLLEDEELYEKMQDSCERIYNEKFTAVVYAGNIEKVYKEIK